MAAIRFFLVVLFLFSIKAIYSISCQFSHTVAVMVFSWFFTFRTGKNPHMIPFKFAMAGRTRLTYAPFRTGPCRGSVRSHLFSLNTVQLDTGTHTHTHIQMVSTWNSSSNPNSSQPWLPSCEGAPAALCLPQCAALWAGEGCMLTNFAHFCLQICLQKLWSPFLCCSWKEAEWYLRESFIYLETLYHALCCFGQSKFEVCKPAGRVVVFGADNRADPRGLERKQEWVAPLQCLYPCYSV